MNAPHKQRDDARPIWLLRKLATISTTRKAMYGELPPDFETWWAQIAAAQLELRLETTPGDWQPWRPVEP
jgi:hypothetical protein